MVDANVDLLIAGTSCVQFSKLNAKNKKKWLTDELRDEVKDLEAAYQDTTIPYSEQASKFPAEKVKEVLQKVKKAIADLEESDSTFFSLVVFVHNHHPKIIILENVKDAPYVMAVAWLRSVQYAALFVDADTKDQYLPQTRQRKYLVAIRMDLFPEPQTILEAWSKHLTTLKRRASSPITDFLLESTSTLTRLSSQQLEHQAQMKTRREPNWERSKDRHDQARENENLGKGHPFSGRGKGLTTNFYDRVNRVVMHRQPPRVWECGDLHLLRGTKAEFPFDARFKTKVWDFSQNVDRNKGGAPPGMAGCLTPNGYAFISDQARFVSGIECLILQGLDPSHTDLSRESHEELKDLAGNAMSTTVVGAVFLALAVACIQNPSFLRGTDSPGQNPQGLAPISEHARRYVHPFSSSENNLQVLQSNLSRVPTFSTWDFERVPWKTVLVNLARDLRMYCYCNGVAKYSVKTLLKCTICGTIRCKRCAGNPVHEYMPIKIMPKPHAQEKAELLFLQYFPSIIHGIIPESLAGELSNRLQVSQVTDALKTAVFYFERVHLTETVTISYVTGSGFRLKATIFDEDLIWYLHLQPHSIIGEEVSKDKSLSKFCLQRRPVARAIVTHTENSPIPSFDDWVPWNFGPTPGQRYADLLVRVTRRQDEAGEGSYIQLGRLDSQQFCPATERIVNSIVGKYEHKPQCDAAENSLHVRKSGGKPLFLFKDPTKTGHASLDTFVISHNPRLIQSHEHREILVSFKPVPKDKQLHNLNYNNPQVAEIAMDGFWDNRRGA
jgi:site-specific DNA-cytosine methylase